MAKWVASPDFVQPTLHTLYNFVIECCRRSVTKLFAIFLLALVTLRRRATVGRLSIGKEIVGARVPPMFVHVSASRGRFLQNPTDTTRERPSLRHTTTLSSWIETLPYAQPPPPDQPASRSRLRPPPKPHPRLRLHPRRLPHAIDIENRTDSRTDITPIGYREAVVDTDTHPRVSPGSSPPCALWVVADAIGLKSEQVTTKSIMDLTRKTEAESRLSRSRSQRPADPLTASYTAFPCSEPPSKTHPR